MKRILTLVIIIISVSLTCYALEQPPPSGKADAEISLTHSKNIEGTMSYYYPLLDVPYSGQIVFDIHNSRNLPIDFSNAAYYLFDLYGNISKCKFNTIYTEILGYDGKQIQLPPNDYEEPYICNPNGVIKISCHSPRALTVGPSTVIGGYIKLKNGEKIGFNYDPSLLGRFITRFKFWWGGSLVDNVFENVRNPKRDKKITKTPK